MVYRCSMVDRGMSLGAGLGGEGEGDLLTARLSNHNFLLIDGIGGISKLGNIETSVLNLVLTLDLCDLNRLGDTHLLGGWVSKSTGDLKWGSHKRNLVGLCLVFFMANLMFSLAIAMVSISISSSWTTSCHLHCLRFLFISNLGGCAWSSDILLLIHIGADLSVNCGRGLLTDSKNSVKAVIIVNHLLDIQRNWSHFVSEGWNTDLSIDRGVCVSAVELWGIAISSISSCCSNESCHNEELK